MKLSRWFGLMMLGSLAVVALLPDVANTQQPSFELPVELVGFPVIILAVRLSNFVKKLAYSLNPRTYSNRRRRSASSAEEADMIDVDEAEKRIVAELGEGACVFNRVCLYHANRAKASSGTANSQLDWEDILSDTQSRQKSYPQGTYYQPLPHNHIPGRYPVEKPYPHPNAPYADRLPYPPGPLHLSPLDVLGSIRDSFVRTLESVALNDELRCVLKLLCEVVTGNAASLRGRQNLLPFNLDMGSLLGMLSQLNLDQASPLLMFGRAILLGYSSQKDPNACSNAYPRCPREPDRLVQYLNNYNGGLFRYFNAFPGQIPENYPSQYYSHLNHPNNPIYNTYQNQYAQQRILSGTNDNQYAVVPSFESIKFPDYVNNYNTYSRVKVPLVFPDVDLNRDLGYRKVKKLLTEPIPFERPLPNHVASPLIFPVRTGTGEFILDTKSFFPENDHYYDMQNKSLP